MKGETYTPETQGSVARWGDKFGQAGPGRLLARMLEEFLELCEACGYDEIDTCSTIYGAIKALRGDLQGRSAVEDIGPEAADVVIMLYQLADTVGFDLLDHVDEKMRINRGRKWKKLADGSYRHD